MSITRASFPFQRLPINLKGDTDSDKLKHRFLPRACRIQGGDRRGGNVREKEYLGFCFINGTWFQMLGEKPDDADTVRLEFHAYRALLPPQFQGHDGRDEADA